MTRLLRARDYRRMPWKNGGGETAEIAISPHGADLAAFEWRISMAPVVTDGPFSRFEGVDRTLAIIEGRGLRLSIGGGEPVDVTRDSAPLAFAADTPASAWLIDGPILDLNVMTRRGRATHRMECLATGQPIQLSADATAAALVCIGGAARVATPGGDIALQRLDTLLGDEHPREAWTVTGEPGAAVVFIEIRAR